MLLLFTAAAVAAGCSTGTYGSTSPGSPVAGTTAATTASGTGGEGPAVAGGPLRDATGAERGQLTVRSAGSAMQLRLEVSGLTPGFHGLHIHAVGKCEPKSPDPKDPAKVGDFTSAGGHLEGGGMAHPAHAGDLPSLYVEANGTGTLTTLTDRFTLEQLADGDGSALVVHASPDNYANIPSRYPPGKPDAETVKAGDAGPRVACAVITRS